MGLTPTSSALAHVQLIPVPVTATPSAAITPPTTGTPATAVATVMPASAITPAATQIGSIFLGEGICPLPEHIRKKILNLEYVDMADLRPESWLMASDTDNANNSLASLFRHRKQPVTDIAVWVQCYSSLVSVLVELYPQFIKHFMAYLSTIVMGAKGREHSAGWPTTLPTVGRRQPPSRCSGARWTSTCILSGLPTKPWARPALPVSAWTMLPSKHRHTRAGPSLHGLSPARLHAAAHAHATDAAADATCTANAAAPGAMPTLASMLTTATGVLRSIQCQWRGSVPLQPLPLPAHLQAIPGCPSSLTVSTSGPQAPGQGVEAPCQKICKAGIQLQLAVTVEYYQPHYL